jgi:glycosyltransferase involved in cell wall biosynthesis
MSNEIMLSICIPARNEIFLARTIQDIIEKHEAEIEIIAVLDGQWAEPAIPQHPMVNIIYVPEAIGQRAGQNLAAKLAKGKYVMKVDAHCAFDQGFDRKMIEFMKRHGDDTTAVPIMRNLHAFDWKCYHCGKKWYQDAEPECCDQCHKGDKIRKKMLWYGKPNPSSWSYCFNAEPRFMYFEDWKHREKNGESNKQKAKREGYSETMSLQGSCFMSTREKYFSLPLCDESFGNWGNQGIELACATWLSGGKVLVNHDTWYAHLFRTKSNFGFPWPASGRDQQKVKQNVKDNFWNRKKPNQIHLVSWLVEKFWPIPGWSDEDLKKLKELEK